MKYSILILILALCIALCACQPADVSDNTTPSADHTETSTNEIETTDAPATEEENTGDPGLLKPTEGEEPFNPFLTFPEDFPAIDLPTQDFEDEDGGELTIITKPATEPVTQPSEDQQTTTEPAVTGNDMVDLPYQEFED